MGPLSAAPKSAASVREYFDEHKKSGSRFITKHDNTLTYMTAIWLPMGAADQIHRDRSSAWWVASDVETLS